MTQIVTLAQTEATEHYTQLNQYKLGKNLQYIIDSEDMMVLQEMILHLISRNERQTTKSVEKIYSMENSHGS